MHPALLYGHDSGQAQARRMSIGLLIADDHELVRAGLRQTFACSDIALVGEASTLEATRQLARDAPADVVLLDISWPQSERAGGGDGFELLADIRAARAQLPILMYSIHERRDFVERCRRLGANGYLVKGIDDCRLVAAVRTVCDGGQLWPPARTGSKIVMADAGVRR